MAAAQPVLSSAAIFGPDDRVRAAPASAAIYNPIGLIESSRTRGTGVIVSPCYAITAQHVIRYDGPVLGQRVWFTAALATHHPVQTAATTVASGGYERYVDGHDPYEVPGSDWALLRLDQCLGSKFGYATLVDADPRKVSGAIVNSAGFPTLHLASRGPLIDPHCSITSVRPLALLNDCATMLGNSGGPIFQIVSTETGKRRLFVYGLQVRGILRKYAACCRPGQDNVATPASEILSHIGQFIRSDEASHSGV
ncbi:MAG: trypsin-like peptidase domain-containing protein [Sphingomonas sp.]|nr:trypsin-like peptidase domain-containing protein [Sphingomonas sp.]